MPETAWLETGALSALIFLVAALYASVGHGGASGYLAAMALFGLAPETMKPAALSLNLFVAGIASYKYIRAGYFNWRLCWPFLLASIPFSFLGGLLQLPDIYYKPLVALVLLYAAAYLFWQANQAAYAVTQKNTLLIALIGAAIGFLSGLVGVGGGIFLSPLLIFFRWEEVKKVSGIAAVFILMNSASGLSGFLVNETFLIQEQLPYWIVAAIFGGYLGAEYGSKRFAPPLIKKLLAVVLLIAATKMMIALRLF